MKKAGLKKLLFSFFTIMVLCVAVTVVSLAAGTNVSGETLPDTAQEEAKEEETTTPYKSDDAKDEDTEEEEQTEAVELVEDSNNDGVYYSSNSGITDFRDETIYFVMTTRFYDGDSSNNVQCWDAQDKNGSDTPWRGDFQGLIDKLDYIKALGFSAIWITPVVKNASGYDYHGYHAINFKEVDSRYESDNCTYQDLIDAVHAKGMKIIQDVVFNHTGNWGEENLYPIAYKNESGDLSDCESSMTVNTEYLPATYFTLTPTEQFQKRTELLMSATYDTNNIYHHNDYIKSWETYDEQVTSIAGDCIDLNTENPVVYKYLVEAYGQYIKMGVDAFRVDTVKHVSRLTYNKALISQLNDIYNEVHGTTGEGNFYMFGEVCTRVRDVWNRNIPAISCPFYTWKESKEYAWDDSNTTAAIETNAASVKQAYEDNSSNVDSQPTSDNAFLSGNTYHTPDYSQASGLNVIDFPMHWNFNSASDAFNVALNGDKYYNDATFNVTYVDSHDYAPDGAPENQRFAGSTETWAENLNLMFTFRGIPCIYYGSEVEFKKGCVIDSGTTTALENTGRAYFGDYIEGSVDVVDFAKYTNATGQMAETLKYPLSLHIQRLNRLRAAIPALRKGQYSTEGCSGSFAFKRRYTDSTTDSFAVVALTSDASFTGIPNGTYTDAITGDVKNVTDGSLSTSGIKGQGDLRVYVLDTSLTKAPGMIEGYSDYMSGGCDVNINVVKPTGISLTKTSASLDLGETVTLSATVSPSDATNKTVSWSTSDASVATVSSGGTVTAKGEGTATIYAATSNATKDDYDNATGLVAKATITVKATGVRVTSLTLSKTSVTLQAGEAATISTTVLPPNASAKYAKVTWTSSDTAVAKVSDSGVISAVKEGTATVTATTADGVSATVSVNVEGTIIYGDAIYFEKPSSWGSTIYVYMWSDDGTYKNKSWPGVPMSVIDEEKGVYGIEWPEGKTDLNVIFNDNSNQTADLEAVINGYYTKDGYQKEVETNTEPVTSSEDTSATKPTETGSDDTTTKPTETDTDDTTAKPTTKPTTKPTETDTDDTTTKPTTKPTETDTDDTTTKPTTKPTETDTDDTTTKPTTKPTETDTDDTTTKPTTKPTETDTDDTTAKPTTKPTETDPDDDSDDEEDIEVTKFTTTMASGKVECGTTVKLSAFAKNATGTVKYRFAVKFEGVTYIIKNYSTKSTVNWRPQEAGKYTLTVYVKDSKNSAKKVISNFVVNTKLKVANFQSSVDGGEAYVGEVIKLSAKGSGGSGKFRYKFAYVLDGKTTAISDYSSSKSVKWTPQEAGTYKLVAYVKDAKSGTVVSRKIKNYVVREDNSLVIDEFYVNRKSGAKLGKTLKFTFGAIGGDGSIKYRITMKFNGETSVIKDYSSKTTYKYKPKNKGTYKFVVTAKDSSGELASDSIYFVVR